MWDSDDTHTIITTGKGNEGINPYNKKPLGIPYLEFIREPISRFTATSVICRIPVHEALESYTQASTSIISFLSSISLVPDQWEDVTHWPITWRHRLFLPSSSCHILRTNLEVLERESTNPVFSFFSFVRIYSFLLNKKGVGVLHLSSLFPPSCV